MDLRPTWMEVYLDNLRYNYRLLKQWFAENDAPESRVFAVLKADAYGLGAIPVAWALKQEGADFFILATADEALEFRKAGITDTLLVLGASSLNCAEPYVRHGIRASISDLEMARALSREAVRQERSAWLHIAVDTGMGRIGFSPEEAPERIAEISRLPGVVCEGIFTHFSTADESDMEYTERQHECFLDVIRRTEALGIRIPLPHCCNSGATVRYPGWGMAGGRPGHLLVGLYPSPDTPRLLSLRAGFSLKTRVSLIKRLEAGKDVGYGRTYTTSSSETIAVLPIGYVDGYDRRFSNNGEVLIRGRRCPIVGRICMDQCMVRVDGLDEVEVGDEVVLLGRQGEEEISVYEYAERIGVIVTQVGPMITARVPRVYI
ncbi:MAG: alanine racemase [Fretibacterium sp.]|nr:alanine racemase [Fretibacterium sp.]